MSRWRLALCTLAMTCLPVAAEPFETVKDFFSALSAQSRSGILAHLTDDFLLLERGELWETEKLIQAVQGDHSRRNFFALIDSVSEGDRAWVAYWNRALIDDPKSGTRELFWLESAVLVRRNNRWLLRMLHSTGTEASSVPPGITLSEHPVGNSAH